jgi:hypothetical protein
MRRFFALSILALSACSRRATPAQCTEMLDRFVDLTIDGDPALQRLPEEQRPAARAQKKQEKRDGPDYQRASTQCNAEVSVREYDCAMKAANGNEWEACID